MNPLVIDPIAVEGFSSFISGFSALEIKLSLLGLSAFISPKPLKYSILVSVPISLYILTATVLTDLIKASLTEVSPLNPLYTFNGQTILFFTSFIGASSTTEASVYPFSRAGE